jgi:hypothetical protein
VRLAEERERERGREREIERERREREERERENRRESRAENSTEHYRAGRQLTLTTQEAFDGELCYPPNALLLPPTVLLTSVITGSCLRISIELSVRNSTAHRWSSGRILPCHGRDPGSIPGRCIRPNVFGAIFF